MALEIRPEVLTLDDGSKYWEQQYDSFYLKTFVPANDLDGQVNNYGFKAPLLMIFEENKSERDGAIDFARKTGLADIAAAYDASGFSMGSGKTTDMFMEYPEGFAGLAPCSALFPVKDNQWSHPIDGRINQDIPVPIFYSGGEESPLPELPFQADTCLERAQYFARVNRLKADFGSLKYEDRDKWADKIWGIPGDRTERIYDETRDSYLTVNYYDSDDGVCRTAFASVSGQQHECRHHSVEHAWRFISRLTRG